MNQSVTAWSAIVIDDQDEDNDFCETLVGKLGDKRIGVVRKKERGMIWDSWNFALDHAEPGLVTLFHSDDVLDPHYVESMLEHATRYPEATAFFTQAMTINGQGRRQFSVIDTAKKLVDLSYSFGNTAILKGESGLVKILRGNFVFCPSLCYVIGEEDQLRFSPYHQVLDFDMLASIILSGKTIVGIPRKLLHYRRHGDNASLKNNHKNIRFKEESKLYDNLSDRAEALGWKRASQVARRKFIVYAHRFFTNYWFLFRRSTPSES